MSSYRGVFQIQSRLWKDLSKFCLCHDCSHNLSLALADFSKNFSRLDYSQNCTGSFNNITQGPTCEYKALGLDCKDRAQTDQTDRQTDRQTDGRTDGRTDRQTD